MFKCKQRARELVYWPGMNKQIEGKVKVRFVLNAVSAIWAILRRPILVAFYDTHGDTEDK